MNKPQKPLLSDIKKIVQELYRINVINLAEENREQHRQALHEAYLALMRAENKALEETLDETNTHLNELAKATSELAKALEEEQDTINKLQLAARGIELLQKIAI